MTAEPDSPFASLSRLRRKALLKVGLRLVDLGKQLIWWGL